MKAQTGKVYKNINTGEVLGNELWLGCNDKATNYIEVDYVEVVEVVEVEVIPESIPTDTERITAVEEAIFAMML